jgi:hypothetical protein
MLKQLLLQKKFDENVAFAKLCLLENGGFCLATLE